MIKAFDDFGNKCDKFFIERRRETGRVQKDIDKEKVAKANAKIIAKKEADKKKKKEEEAAQRKMRKAQAV